MDFNVVVVVLPCWSVFVIYVLRVCSILTIMRIVGDWSCMQMTVFITLLQFNFNEKPQVIFISKHISAEEFFMLQKDGRWK